MLFTDQLIKNLKPRKSAHYVREKGADKGFCVKIQPSGGKAFYLSYMLDGRERFFRLGSYPEMSLANARKACRQARALVDQGIDPQEARRRQMEEERARKLEESHHGTVGQLFDHYLEYLRTERSEHSAYQVAHAYRKDVLPVIDARMKARDVTPENIRLILNRITKRGAMIQANRVRSYLMAAFQRAIEHDHNPRNLDADVLFSLKYNPVRDIPRIVKREPTGERDLSKEELARFWRLLDTYTGMDFLTLRALKLILATGGQRVKEVVEAQWSEFDLNEKVWELPPNRTKNRRMHLVPLNDLAIGILGDLAPLTGEGRFLFPKRSVREEPMRLDSISQALHRFCKRTDFEKFTPRDLRRTCKTRMGELGLSKEIRDRLHNHALNDVSARHYDRYDYLPQKRQAMDAWGNYLEDIIRGADVVPIGEAVKQTS